MLFTTTPFWRSTYCIGLVSLRKYLNCGSRCCNKLRNLAGELILEAHGYLWRAACCLLTEMAEILLLKVEACIRPVCELTPCIRPVCRSFDLYQICLFKKL